MSNCDPMLRSKAKYIKVYNFTFVMILQFYVVMVSNSMNVNKKWFEGICMHWLCIYLNFSASFSSVNVNELQHANICSTLLAMCYIYWHAVAH